MNELITTANISVITGSVVLSAAVGGLIAGVVALWNGSRQRIAEAEMKTRELALTLALEEWKYHREIAETQLVKVSSPDVFVFRYHQILTKMKNGTLDEEAMGSIQHETMRLMESTRDAIMKFRKDHDQPAPFNHD